MSTEPEGAELHSYVVSVDTGFAPNVTGGTCTLATCKQVIRSEAEEGDWVLGTNPRSADEERVAYLMRVGETLTYDEYHRHDRFTDKKAANDPVGDNIYYRNDEGELVQVENPPAHDDADCREKDRKSDCVLVADRFWYFGDRAPTLPRHLREEVVKGYGTSSRSGRKKPTEHLDELLGWIEERYEPGVHGKPRDGPEGACGCEGDEQDSSDRC